MSSTEASGNSHYFEADPSLESNPRTIELVLPDAYLTLGTDAGVFSNTKVDSGTRFLLQDHPAIAEDRSNIVDIGCGYGPIALAAAKRAPNAQVIGVDVNTKAIELSKANAAANDITNARFMAPDEVDPNLRFDLILSNPPIRIGKPALHELLAMWLDRLSPNGKAYLVVQKHLGSDSLADWLTVQGWQTTRLGSRKGFRLLETLPREEQLQMKSSDT